MQQVLFSAMGDLLASKHEDMPAVIAEDLGVITDDVRSLLAYSAMPGMRVLQFAFSEGQDNPHLPHNYVENTVAYTGTHDNNTTLGYLLEAPEWERVRMLDYCAGGVNDHRTAVHEIIKRVMASRAGLVMIPIQDILAYGSDTRMNTPGTSVGNWAYRTAQWQLDSVDRSYWRYLNNLFAR